MVNFQQIKETNTAYLTLSTVIEYYELIKNKNTLKLVHMKLSISPENQVFWYLFHHILWEIIWLSASEMMFKKSSSKILLTTTHCSAALPGPGYVFNTRYETQTVPNQVQRLVCSYQAGTVGQHFNDLLKTSGYWAMQTATTS